MRLTQRQIGMIGIALATIIFLTLLFAPSHSPLQNGSTYNRDPAGYAAWYEFMEQRGTPIQRWKKPLKAFPGVENQDSVVRQNLSGFSAQLSAPKIAQTQTPITLLRINPTVETFWLTGDEEAFIREGNRLVILGVRQQVTAADFKSEQESPQGPVLIATRRRHSLEQAEQQRLGDRFGAVVWQENLESGQVIFATTPYLAANAYQDSPANYEFLAALVTENQFPLWVDEYIHGYRDQDAIADENSGSWVLYLAKTPLLPILLQIVILMFVLIYAQNRRFGHPQPLEAPVIDNSEAYIRALASVLHKANCHDFVVEMVGKEEQRQLQKSLGFGDVPIDENNLIDAWVQQTGGNATDLKAALNPLRSHPRRFHESELFRWLQKWQQIRKTHS